MASNPPLVPRGGASGTTATRVQRNRRSDLAIWWREIDRVLLGLVLALMATCPACGEEIIAGYRDGGEWIQTMGDADTLRTFPEYTHWQYAPEGPK